MNAVASARRLLLAAGVALTVGIPILACSGGGETDGTEEPAENPAARLVGTWRILPDDETLRMLKIINGALKNKKDNLGELTKDEEALFKEWQKKDRKSQEVKSMKALLRFVKGCVFEFTDKQVTVKFGKDETFGPVPYEVVSATENNTTVKFDPGLGNGTETHSFDWTSATEGTDNITAPGKEFTPFNVKKI